MKRILALLLILPALALAQGRFGHGGTTASQMLPIITDAISDSSRWTAGTHIHAIKPKGGKSVQADSAKFGYLNVTGDTQLDGNLTMNTVASESLKVLAGGIRNEGGLIQKGNSSFGVQQTPKSTLQITGRNISAVNYYKGLRLSNPDAATSGVQALSPALVFRGAGWKTNATAGSDSVLWGVYVLPEQGTNNPSSRISFVSKTGTGSWTERFFAMSSGSLTVSDAVIASRFVGNSINGAYAANGNNYFIADADNAGSDGVIVFGRSGYLTPGIEYARFLHNGNFGIGTTTPAALLYVNNGNVLSKPLFRLGRDKNATPDSVSLMVTGTGKISFGPNLLTAGMTPADTLNLVNIMGKKSTDSLFVVHNDIVGRDSVFAVLPTGGITAASMKLGSSNFTTTQIDTVFTAGYVPRWVKFTSGAKTWYSPVYADTTGKW